MSGQQRRFRRIFQKLRRREPEIDPELLLFQAQTELRAIRACHRERIVKLGIPVSTEKELILDYERHVQTLREQATRAKAEGNETAVWRICKDAQEYEEVIAIKRERLEKLTRERETLTEAFKHEEDAVRQMTAEAIALKAQWQTSKIQIEMDKAIRDWIQDHQNTTRKWERAKRRIREVNAAQLVQSEMESWGFKFEPPIAQAESKQESSGYRAWRRLARAFRTLLGR